MMYARIIIILFFPIFAIAQAPQKINFQSILRNSSGEVIGNKSVGLKISILSGSIDGLSVYSETHAKTTDASGLISLQIGNGTVISGIFVNIDWGGASHFIKLEADFSGGSNYVVLGTQELMSVPYAMYASKTDTSVLNLASRLAKKLNVTDTVSLSNRINANANSGSSDTSLLNLTTRLATKLNVTDTASLSNRIDLKLTKTDTASLSNRIDDKLTKTDTASLSNRIDDKLTKTDTASLSNRIDAKLSKPESTVNGDILYYNNNIWSRLPIGQEGQILTVISGKPNWSSTATGSPPTGVSATSGNGSASVSFVAPASNGGTTITGYIVTSNPGNISATGTTSPINVTGLTNGTAYTFTVVAVGVASAASTAVTPVTVPSASTSVVATAGNSTASVAFVASKNDGGSAITGYTVTSNPGNISVSGTTSPINVTGLTNGTAYTFTVVATNAVGNSVASVASTAVTPATVPSAPTGAVATAGNNSASVAFVASTNNGGTSITRYEVTSNPGGITATGTTSPINVTGLTNGTAYTFTVVATNAMGNSASSTASTVVTPNVCPTSTITDIDGNTYPIVSIGNQCWMSENLKTSRYRNGGLIPNVTNNTAWSNSTIGARSYYDNDEANNVIYGTLYNWYTTRGDTLCPTGWGVPTDAEWTTLTEYLEGEEVAGGKMKTIGTTYWNSPNTGANNSSGFSVLPGGYRIYDGSFGGISYNAFFWSASEDDNDAWGRILGSGNSNVARITSSKSVGASVRCLRD